MQDDAKDWRAALSQLLEEEGAAYAELDGNSLTLRRALIQGDAAEIQAQIRHQQMLLARLSRLERRRRAHCDGRVAQGAAGATGLRRLVEAEAVRVDPALLGRVERTGEMAARVAERLAHNRHLIARLVRWSQDELRLLLEPLSAGPAYGAHATQVAAPAPAWIDRRG